MAIDKATSLTGLFPIENSEYKKIYLLEHQEIEKNKYYLSQQSGTEVSYEHALWNWHFCHRDEWMASIKASGSYI